MNMILTSECEECRYGLIDDTDKAKVKVKCIHKDKEYYFGQCIPCENKKKRKSVFIVHLIPVGIIALFPGSMQKSSGI